MQKKEVMAVLQK